MEKVFSETGGYPNGRWLRYWAPLVLYAGLIFYLSSLPHPEETLPKVLLDRLGDKALHVIEYALFGALAYRAFRWAAGPAAARRAVMLAIAAASFYGLTDELHQAFVPFRESSWLDWVADTLGGAIGAIGVKHATERDMRPAVP